MFRTYALRIREIATTIGSKRGSWPFLLALFSASSVLEVIAWGHVEAFMPLFLAEELGVSNTDVPAWTGVLAAAPMAVAVPLSPFWGVLADRHNRKLIILRTALVGSVAYLLAALSQEVWHLLGARLLMGLSFGGNAIVMATIAAVVPDRRVGLAIGLFQMMLPLGRSIGPLLGSGLISLFGLRGMFVTDALFSLSALLLILVLFQDRARHVDASLGVFERLAAVARLVWRAPSLRLNFALFALFAGISWLIMPFLPVLIDRVHDGEDVALVIGLILAGYGGVAAITAPFAGRLADVLGPARVVLLTMVGLMLMSLGLLFASTPLQVGLVVLLGGIPYGAGSTTLYTHLARHTPSEHMASVMGLTPMARNIAMLVGPLVGAAVSGFGLAAVFATAAALCGVAVGLSLRLQRAGGGG